MTVTQDRYGGITIALETISKDITTFTKDLEELLKTNKDKKFIWITLPIELSHYIPLLTAKGFLFFSAKEKEITLNKKQDPNLNVPTAVNHTIAVGTVVIHKNKILLIRDRFSEYYKFPSGTIEDDESVSECVIREVLEETGIRAEFVGIKGLSHMTNSQFGESNLYAICEAKALTTEINIIDTQEIAEALWMDLEEFFSCEKVHDFPKKIVKETEEKSGLLPFNMNADFKHEMFL